jgi:hypothetical protein
MGQDDTSLQEPGQQGSISNVSCMCSILLEKDVFDFDFKTCYKKVLLACEAIELELLQSERRRTER